MSSNLNYTKTGDYFLPNLTLNQPRKQLNRYGRIRRNYLMEQRPVRYSTMLLNGTLYPHLWEVEQTAENRMQQLMNDLLERNPAPDKETNRMAWVQLGKTADSCGVPLHNPTIRFREEALPVGAAAYASGADVWLEAHAKE